MAASLRGGALLENGLIISMAAVFFIIFLFNSQTLFLCHFQEDSRDL